jgi:predicted nucleic acid-binding protein
MKRSVRSARVRNRTAVVPRCVLDSGAISALVGPSLRARAWLRWLAENGGVIVVPTPVLVECTRGDGARDAEVNRILHVLRGVAFAAPNEATARKAAALRHRARMHNGIDALVAAEAVGRGERTVLLTSDPDDMGRLLSNETTVTVQGV